MEDQARRGQPTKLTPETHKIIEDHLHTGVTIETACAAAGIAAPTYRLWLKKGREALNRIEAKPTARLKKEERPLVDFVRMADRTLALVKARMVGEIAQTGTGYEVRKVVEVYERVNVGTKEDPVYDTVLIEQRVTTDTQRDWKASAWLLERRHAEEFSLKTKVEHTGEGVIAIAFNAPANLDVADPGAEGEA